jgi:hypothetical protein
MTIREAIHDYLHWLSSTGDQTDDSSESNLGIYQALLKSRAVVMTQFINAGAKINEEAYQVLRCIDLEERDVTECGLVPKSGCTLLRSTCPIPDVIKIQSVSRLLGDKYSYTRWDDIRSKVGGRLKSAAKEKFYSLRTIEGKTYLYIYNDETIKSITATAIFEDPMEATLFCGDNEEVKCNPIDTSFYTPQNMLDTIIKQTWDSTIRVRASAKMKALNNDSPVDQTTQVPKR